MRKSVLRGAALALICVAVSACGQNASKTGTEPPASQQASPQGAANSNFEAWQTIGTPTVQDAAAAAPDGTNTADALVLDTGDGVANLDQRPVAAGETVSGKVNLWGTEGQTVALQLVRWCSSTPSEVETVNVSLTATPTEYEVSRAFQNAHDCVRFQIIMTGAAGTVNAWNGRVERAQ